MFASTLINSHDNIPETSTVHWWRNSIWPRDVSSFISITVSSVVTHVQGVTVDMVKTYFAISLAEFGELCG